MHGLEHEVRAAVNMLLELDIVKVRVALTPEPQRPPFNIVSIELPSRDPLPD